VLKLSGDLVPPLLEGGKIGYRSISRDRDLAAGGRQSRYDKEAEQSRGQHLQPGQMEAVFEVILSRQYVGNSC
jgi:hypothetical protein